MNRLLPCPNCSRHVRVTETQCRFCNAELDFSSAAELVLPKSRLSRAATFTFGATLVGATTLIACGETEEDKEGAGGAAGANVGAQSAGGSSAKGGSGGSGGTTAQGGSNAQGGSAGKGGTTASGGSTAQGGTAQGGSAQGGTAGQGGRNQAGSGGTIAPPYGIPPQDD